MKYLFCLIVLLTFSIFAQAQRKAYLRKTWIKVSSQDLSGNITPTDSVYTRYTFNKETVNVSLNPAWDQYSMTWKLEDAFLSIGFESYKLLEHTDSSLVLEVSGFRRIRLLSEEYIINRSDLPQPIDTLNGLPVYIADKVITPRYQKDKSLDKELLSYHNGYNIRQLTKFRVGFIVDDKGAVHNIKVVEGISQGFDQAMVNAIAKTSKKWKPAIYKGKPIQTLVYFESNYVNSTGTERLGR